MRRIALLCVIMTSIYSVSSAQTSFELIPTGGYIFPDQVNFTNTYGKLDESVSWGGSMMFNASRNFGIELMYQRIDATTGVYNYNDQLLLEQKTVGMNYIMAGPVISLGGGAVHPFIGALLGVQDFSPDANNISANNNYFGYTKFAWGADAGTTVYVSPRLGIRLKAQVLSPVDATSGMFYFGSGGPAAYYNSYPTVFQFGFSAGLIIGLGEILSRPGGSKVIIREAPVRRYYSPYPPPSPSPYYH